MQRGIHQGESEFPVLIGRPLFPTQPAGGGSGVMEAKHFWGG